MAALWALAKEWCYRHDVTLIEVSSDGRGFYVVNEDGRESFVNFKKVNL